LRVLIRSEIHVIRHVFLVGPRLQERHGELCQLLSSMRDNDTVTGQDVLNNLGLQGWEMQSQEDTEFMIDLMDTLVN
jgi:phosphonate transport system substrate-binding protein